MLNPAEQAKIDQSAAVLVENLPPLWRQMYLKCVSEGFSEAEAFRLLQTYILKDGTHGVNGTTS